MRFVQSCVFCSWSRVSKLCHPQRQWYNVAVLYDNVAIWLMHETSRKETSCDLFERTPPDKKNRVRLSCRCGGQLHVPHAHVRDGGGVANRPTWLCSADCLTNRSDKLCLQGQHPPGHETKTFKQSPAPSSRAATITTIGTSARSRWGVKMRATKERRPEVIHAPGWPSGERYWNPNLPTSSLCQRQDAECQEVDE